MDAVFPIIIAKMIKVLIADDQELIRESLKIILGAHDNIEIVGVVGNGYEVLETLKKHKVDIILMDIRMPKMDGVYCTKLVKEQYPEIKIVILTTFDDDEYIFSALKYGASGYLLKDVGMEELYEDIMVKIMLVWVVILVHHFVKNVIVLAKMVVL